MSKITLQWKTEKRKVADLIPADYNPRQMNENERKDLMASIKEFDQVVPVVINSDGKLIGGHQRCKIYIDLGIEEIEVRVPNRKLDLEEEKRLNLRLNKNTGSWDFEKLGDFGMETLLDIGFREDDLSNIWDENNIEDDKHEKEKAIAEAKNTDIKLGDIYQLGNHKLMCGDSTNEDQVKMLVGDNKIQMIYCDPPYNIGLDYKGGLSGKDKYKGVDGDKLDDSKTIGDYSKFIEDTLKNALSVADKNVHVFYWCDEKYIWLLQTLFNLNGVSNKRVCLWIKNNANPVPQIAFNKVYEPCIYGTIGRPFLNTKFRNLHEILNMEVSSGNQVIEELTDFFNVWLAHRGNTQGYEHPTQKPLNLHEKPIKRTTRVGENILDLFGGSGSTLISAEQLGRKSFLIEMDPIFCQVIINRWEELSNKKAVKLTN